MKEYIPFLCKTTLFKGISPSEMEGMLTCLTAKVSSYNNKEIVLMEGQSINSVGIVLEGKVQVIKEDFTGKRTILTEVGEGNLFAETFACVQTESLPITVISVSDCRVLWVNYRDILTTCPALCGYHNKLIENMMQILASKNILLSQKIEHIARRTTKDKILAYLSDQARQQGKTDFNIPFNRQELADYLCVDRSAMSNELCKLRNQGILDFNMNRFVLRQVVDN